MSAECGAKLRVLARRSGRAAQQPVGHAVGWRVDGKAGAGQAARPARAVSSGSGAGRSVAGDMAGKLGCETTWPLQEACGFGSCVEGGCVCDEGWGSAEDFAAVPGRLCAQPVLVMRVVYGVLASLALAALARAVYHMVQVERALLSGIPHQPLIVRLHRLASFGLGCTLALWLCKCYDPRRFVIGGELVCTVTWWVAIASLHLAMLTLYEVYLGFAESRIAESGAAAGLSPLALVLSGKEAKRWLGCATALAYVTNLPILVSAAIKEPRTKDMLSRIRFGLLMLDVYIAVCKLFLPTIDSIISDLGAVVESLEATGDERHAAPLRSATSLLSTSKQHRSLLRMAVFSALPVGVLVLIPIVMRFAFVSELLITVLYVAGSVPLWSYFHHRRARLTTSTTVLKRGRSVLKVQPTSTVLRESNNRSKTTRPGSCEHVPAPSSELL